jgi:hypothetical protein
VPRSAAVPVRDDVPAPADAGAIDAVPLAPLPGALPVALDLRGSLADEVRRVVEGSLGWQPVDDHTAGLVPPVVRLADVAAEVGDGTPTVLVVTAADAPRAAADAGLRLRPTVVIPWPCAEDELVRAVASATAAPRGAVTPTPTVRLGGAAGGVGTTTVALALAGAAAWRGLPVLLASPDAVLLPEVAPGIDPAALAAPDLWSRAAPLEGVPGARAVRTYGSTDEVAVVDPSVGAVVLDLGVATDVDVLVLRADAAGLTALGGTTASTAVVAGRGPASPRSLHEAIGRRRRIDLPWSTRVGRAGLVGRAPAAFPGTFIRAVSPLLPGRTTPD